MHFRHLLIPFCLTVSGIILFFHFLGEPDSMLNLEVFRADPLSGNWSNTYLESVVDHHLKEWTFSKRSIFTSCLLGVSSIFSISNSMSFLLCNAFLLVVNGYLIGRLALKFSNNIQAVFASTTIFYLSFPILFAFYPPVYTYEDLLQIAVILASILFLVDQKWLLFSVFILMAILVRETTLFILPILLLYVNTQQKKKITLYLLIPAISGILFWIITLSSSGSTIASRPACLIFNFSDTPHIIETIFSLMCAFLPVWLISRFVRNAGAKRLFLLVFGVNALIVLCFAYARETRLFYLPIYFLIPMVDFDLKKISSLILVTQLRVVLLFILIFSAAFTVIHLVYQPTIAQTSELSFEIYASIALTLVVLARIAFTFRS